MNVVSTVDESACVTIDLANRTIVNNNPFQALCHDHSGSTIQSRRLLITRLLMSSPSLVSCNEVSKDIVDVT